MEFTRRGFLGGLGAAAIAAASPSVQAADGSDAKATSHGREPIDKVNVLQGTDSSDLFSRGNTLPLIALPFGMAHWTLQSNEDTPWFFHPRERRIQGIRCTHQLSPWLSDYGHATFLPFTGEAKLIPAVRASSYRPEDTELHPYSMHLELLRNRTLIELAPTERCAALRLTFKEKHGALAVDLPGKDATIKLAGDMIIAIVRANSGGVVPGFGTYYAIRSSAPMTLEPTTQWKSHALAALRFTHADDTPIMVKIGTSFISAEQAIRNMESEIGDKSFDSVRDKAKAVWSEHLSRATVEGGTEEQQRIFYSAMYRALLFPRVWHEPDEHGTMQHWSPYSGKVEPGVLYADHGYWDVYRAWYPMMSILFPERLGEILQAWVNASREGGWMPQFPCPGYRACMTGSLIDAVFADAAVKGIRGFDLEAAYQMLRKHATSPGDPEKGYGRRGIEEYLRLGYCPVRKVSQAVAETVDAAYGDFCIAQIAEVLGHRQDAQMFRRRSENWRNLFDAKTGFLRGKEENGRFHEPFDPIQWGDPYVEGSAWQHRFDVPHQPEALMEALGGKAAFTAALEEMLTQEPRFHIGVYGREIHEMSEMAAVNFGQYAHSNQPVHHVLYLYAIAGRRDRLQYWVRRVLTELYTVDTFAGDEDTGSMSAWFLLSSMGFYSLCPGKPEYVLGAPLFRRVVLTPQGHNAPITIEAQQNGPDNLYVNSITIDGQGHIGHSVSHEALIRAKHIHFTMVSESHVPHV